MKKPAERCVVKLNATGRCRLPEPQQRARVHAEK